MNTDHLNTVDPSGFDAIIKAFQEEWNKAPVQDSSIYIPPCTAMVFYIRDAVFDQDFHDKHLPEFLKLKTHKRHLYVVRRADDHDDAYLAVM